MSRTLLLYPDPQLSLPCKPVEKIDSYVRDVVRDLQDWLNRPAEGTRLAAIGLAAPQLGELIRVFAIRFRGLEWVVINPTVIKAQGQWASSETCMSLPGQSFVVPRCKRIKLSALDMEGHHRGYHGHDLLAALLEHELDHLNGVMISDFWRTRRSTSQKWPQG